MFNTKKQIKIKTNTLDLTTKVCFSQQYKNKRHFFAYLLRKLSLSKLNYNILDKKLLVIQYYQKYKEYIQKKY